MSTIAQENSLFEIDQELDLLLDEIQEQTATEGEEEIPAELMLRFQPFCYAHYEKVRSNWALPDLDGVANAILQSRSSAAL